MIAVTAPGHPVRAGAGYDCCCGECLHRRVMLPTALKDALAYRKDRAGGYCAGCEREYGGLCYDHAGDEEAADAYAALARELEAGR